MSNPWMKFYPSDWRSDPAVRMCSIGARGLWIEMLALMHEAVPYGHLTVNGIKITPEQLGALTSVRVKDVLGFLVELTRNGVFSMTDAGVIYSRRMVRDFEKAERDKANGRGGGNPRLKAQVKEGVNPQDNVEDKAQKPEATYQVPVSEQRLETESKNIKSVVKKSWTPPKHGAQGRGRIYLQDGTPEWDAYAADYREAHGIDPVPNSHGGKWFKTTGESPLPVPTHHGILQQ